MRYFGDKLSRNSPGNVMLEKGRRPVVRIGRFVVGGPCIAVGLPMVDRYMVCSFCGEG
jgi:hypothetical protein